MPQTEQPFYQRLWTLLRRPSTAYSLGTLLVVGFVSGILFWGGFNTVLEATNTETFCISCHEMSENVYKEYRGTIHYTNRTGVRAVCSDCHVPKDYIHKLARKVRATNEVFHKILGSINTREKFEAKRLELAQSVWKTMKETDSRECRNCHDYKSMDFSVQKARGGREHAAGFEEGKTCIDCHKGIAHTLPPMPTDTFGQPQAAGEKPHG
jgi:cytochrome c-type protein NapC